MDNQQYLGEMSPEAAVAKESFAEMRGTPANYINTENANMDTEKTQSIIDKAVAKSKKRIDELNKKALEVQKEADTEEVLNVTIALLNDLLVGDDFIFYT